MEKATKGTCKSPTKSLRRTTPGWESDFLRHYLEFYWQQGSAFHMLSAGLAAPLPLPTGNSNGTQRDREAPCPGDSPHGLDPSPALIRMWPTGRTQLLKTSTTGLRAEGGEGSLVLAGRSPGGHIHRAGEHRGSQCWIQDCSSPQGPTGLGASTRQAGIHCFPDMALPCFPCPLNTQILFGGKP